MTLKLDVLCNDGSPLGVSSKSIWGDGWIVGVGGSEISLLTLCEEWTKRGDTVILYNNPREQHASPFEQRRIDQFDPNGKRDILINFRSPNPRTALVHNCLKVWFSTDQQSVGDYRSFSSHVDKIVCISPRHARYFKERYDIEDTTVIDLPVRMGDYDKIRSKEVIEKVPNRIIFTSVPARGLDNLWRTYPLIQKEVPDVSLVITSDYRLWGSGAGNEQFRVKWMPRTGVEFLGAIPRQQLLYEQLKSQITLYPCNYDELFCIAIAESQYAASYPITSGMGALATTNMGKIIEVNPDDPRNDSLFAQATVDLLRTPKLLTDLQQEVYLKAKERFSPEKILKEWDEHIFNS